MIDDRKLSALERAAREAAGRAYCPYSRFPVGAAVLAADGQVHSGCNVENASYGLTICAERNAVFQAVARTVEPLHIKAVLVYTPTASPTAPCGACRQVLLEFMEETAPVYLVGQGGVWRRTNLAELLPDAFSPRDLESGS
jgi:cytidine deaminase